MKWCGRRILQFIKAEYGDRWPIYILENGSMDKGDTLEDHERMHYLKTVLSGIYKGQFKYILILIKGPHLNFLN